MVINRELKRFQDDGYYEEDAKFEFPNSIHNERSIKFFNRYIANDDWIEKILKEGLSLILNEKPLQYEEDNNNSAKQNMPKLREIIRNWELEGKVEKLKFKPAIVNPMSVIIQNKLDGSVKVRPVIDCSRYLNKKFVFGSVKLDDLKSVETLLQQDDYFCSIDFQSMYHQIWLNSTTAEILNFCIISEKGSREYYKFKVMQFGISPAVFVVTKLLLPVRNYFRSIGIRYSCFIDDSIVCSQYPELAKAQINFVMTVFKLLGWKINLDKSSLIPSKKVVYLGFIINSEQMKYFYPAKKLVEVKELLLKVLQMAKNKEQIHVKIMAKLLGKICHLTRSHGKIVAIFSRKCQHIVGKNVHFFGWDTTCILDYQAIVELTFLYNNLNFYNGRKIFKSRKSVIILNNSYEIQEDDSKWLDNEHVFVSDASASKSFIYNADESFTLVDDFYFNDLEKSYSSGHRELLSISKTLEKYDQWFKSNSGVVYWLTDSRNVYSFLMKGSRKLQIQQDIVKIKKYEKLFDVQIVPIWAPRNDRNIQFADIGSKMHNSSDEWGIDEMTFKFIQSYFQIKFNVDAFATSENAKCEKFFSKIPQLNSAGINFYTQELQSENVYWLCPPVKEINNVVEYVNNFVNIKAALFVPVWAGALYWFSLIEGKYFKEIVSEYLLVSPKYVNFSKVKNVFEGYKKFKGMVILIDTNKNSKNKIKIPENILQIKRN